MNNFKTFPGKFYCQNQVSLRNKTWIGRGGMVNNWFTPTSIEELTEIAKYLFENNLEWHVIGHTSNTYFKNDFDIDCIVDTRKLKKYTFVDDKTLMCECGVPISEISRLCIERGCVGYEGLVGLPGTVGGGIFCNSGCYGCGIEKILLKVEILLESGEIKCFQNEEMKFGFRSSIMKRGELKGIILRAYFNISQKGNNETLQIIAKNNMTDRKCTQDGPSHNLGSTVNYRGFKKNTRNLIIRILSRIYDLLSADKRKKYLFVKNLICTLYNCSELKKYISDKRMNCFLWRDEKADEYFPKYIELMNTVYDNCSTEIIIKS